MGAAHPALGLLRRQILLDTGGVGFALPVGLSVQTQLLTIIPIGDGFELEAWSAGYSAIGTTAGTLMVENINVAIQFCADPACGFVVGAVNLPMILSTALPNTSPITAGGQAYVSFEFGPDIQTPGGFARFWQIYSQTAVSNTGAGPQNVTIATRALYR
jgi:hypothetical protein